MYVAQKMRKYDCAHLPLKMKIAAVNPTNGGRVIIYAPLSRVALRVHNVVAILPHQSLTKNVN